MSNVFQEISNRFQIRNLQVLTVKILINVLKIMLKHLCGMMKVIEFKACPIEISSLGYFVVYM